MVTQTSKEWNFIHVIIFMLKINFCSPYSWTLLEMLNILISRTLAHRPSILNNTFRTESEALASIVPLLLQIRQYSICFPSNYHCLCCSIMKSQSISTLIFHSCFRGTRQIKIQNYFDSLKTYSSYLVNRRVYFQREHA